MQLKNGSYSTKKMGRFEVQGNNYIAGTFSKEMGNDLNKSSLGIKISPFDLILDLIVYVD